MSAGECLGNGRQWRACLTAASSCRNSETALFPAMTGFTSASGSLTGRLGAARIIDGTKIAPGLRRSTRGQELRRQG